ncbi:MAG: rhomboid family intramembrane serine protease [Proteobacteria bacterium]|nr:rhomboid family intramembrane serine protease [Pseudomonadota bacterium]MBU1737388.1 rhomboid family intramembrane serine protease [Pseudomonadota bacterium]
MHVQQKNSMLCPGCRKLISRSEEKCPYCGIRNPGSWLKNNRLVTSLSNPDQLIRMVLYANITMFVLSILLNPGRANFNIGPFSFLSPGDRSLLLLGATGTVPILKLHRWWSLLSANYLHGGLLHIIFNMIALHQLGPLVAREFGTHRMFAIYTLGGVLGFFVSFLAGIPFTIGASAAVCSLIGALLYYGKSRGGTYGQAVYSQIGSWAIMIMVFGFLVPGINNWGHGGGMAAGAALAYLLGYHEVKRETPGHRLLGVACGVATLLVLAWAGLNGLSLVLLR